MPLWMIFSFISSFLSAAAAVVEKQILKKLHPVHFTLLFSVFTLFFSLPLIPLAPSFSKLTPLMIGAITLKALLESFQFTSVMWGIKKLGLSAVLPLMVTVPGIVAIIAWPMLGDKLSRPEIIGLIILLIGTYIHQLKDLRQPLSPFHPNHRQMLPIIIAITANTIAALLDRSLLSQVKINPLHYLVLQHAFMVVFMLLALPLFRLSLKACFTHLRPYLGLFILLAVMTVGYRYAQMRAVMIAPVALVLAVRRTSTFFATVAGGTIFKEEKWRQRALAVIAMLVGVYFLAQ